MICASNKIRWKFNPDLPTNMTYLETRFFVPARTLNPLQIRFQLEKNFAEKHWQTTCFFLSSEPPSE